MPGPENPSRLRYVIPAVLALVVVLTYLPSMSNGFTNWDDYMNLRDNPDYRGLGWTQVKWMWTATLLGHYQPLAWMSLGLDYVVWGMNPMGYHLTSVLLHAANSVLLYSVILAFLRLQAPASSPWPGILGALFHALHPLRVESVVWVTERRDVLCGFFALLSLLAYLKRVEEERAGRPATKWLVLSCVAFAASLLSKALGIMLPVVLLILDVYPLRRFKPEGRLRILLEKIPFFLLSLGDGVAMIIAMRNIGAVRSVAGFHPLERIAQAAYGLCFYPWKTIWPMGLIPIYRVDTPLNPWQAKYLLPMAAVVGVTVALWRARDKCPAALIAWVCYVVLLLPVLGIAVTGAQIAADRYTYLAMIPAAVLIAAGLRRFFVGEFRTQKNVLSLAAALLVLLSVATLIQIPVWKDSITLWSHQLKYDPDSSLAWNSRGAERQDRGDAAGAIADCTKAIELDPNSADPYLNRGLALAARGDATAAIRDFDVLVRLDPNRPRGYQNRGIARMQRNDLDGASADLAEALRLGGDVPVIHQARGLVKARKGDFRGAVEEFDEALRTAPPDWPRRREVEALREKARRS